MNMQTSFMHPPFGFCAVLPALGGASLHQDDPDLLGAVPFVIIQIIMVAIIITFPQLVTMARQAGEGGYRLDRDRGARRRGA